MRPTQLFTTEYILINGKSQHSRMASKKKRLSEKTTSFGQTVQESGKHNFPAEKVRHARFR